MKIAKVAMIAGINVTNVPYKGGAPEITSFSSRRRADAVDNSRFF